MQIGSISPRGLKHERCPLRTGPVSSGHYSSFSCGLQGRCTYTSTAAPAAIKRWRGSR